MHIRFMMLGKTRRPEFRAIFDDYVKRVSRYVSVEVDEARDAAAATKKLESSRPANIVLLDAAGKVFSSEAFAKWLGDLRDRATREIIFLCGDAEGFPDSLRECADQKLSLSSLTFSHELARVMLAEQLYRAVAILSGSPYPK